MIAITKEEFCSRVLDCESAMYHSAYAILKNDADCADAVQDAILKAYKSLGTLRKPEYFKTWIIRILINTCYSQLKSRRFTEDIDNLPNESVPAADDFTKTELMLEISALDEKYRLPFMLYYMEGFTAEEIGKVIGLPAAAVRKRLSRARASLRDALAESV